MRFTPELDASGRGFTWRVARAGYELVECEWQYGFAGALYNRIPLIETRRRGVAFRSKAPSPPDTCKTEADYEAWQREQMEEYAPDSRRSLHRAFARIKSTEEEARKFVNNHGPITAGFAPPFLDDFFAAQELIRDILKLAKRQSVPGGKVEDIINKNRLHFLLRMTVNKRGKLVHQVIPESLLGWMLLQAVREVSGSMWRDCEFCGAEFEVSDGRQSRQRFCSDRCRLGSFRESRRH